MTSLLGYKNNTQRSLSRLMMTSALVAAGTLVLSSSAMADPWSDVGGTGFTNTSGGSGITNIVATTANGKASGTGNLDILTGETVNIDAKLFVARDNRATIQTQILGNLNSNGTVVLIDRNGIIFGKDSRVDVGSLIATTGNISDSLALADANAPLLFTNFGTGDVTNQGNIEATGLIAFVAPTVKNSGIINANLGSVSLVAGSTTATIDLYGDSLVELATSPMVAADAKYLSENTGSITGGKIQMTAAAAKSVVDSVVNMQGVLTANSAFVNTKGDIVLSAGKVVLGSTSAKSPTIKGNTNIKATQLDLGLTVDGDISGSAKVVNVLSTKAKIAQGLKVVSANSTVNVAAGTYNEHLVIDKNGVTINGANAGKSANGVRGAETIINPNSPGVEIISDNVTIDGLTFSGAAGADGYGIFVNGGDNATLKNNIILNVAQSGIYVLNSIGGIISDNNIGASGATKNIGKDGIHLLNTSGITVSGNTIANTTSPSIEVGSGIYAENSDDTIISGNTIYRVTWDGIKVRGGSGTQITANDIYNLSRSGIGIDETENVVIADNIIDNVILGVWSYHNSDIQILDNTVTNITTSVNSNGIQTYEDDGVLISGNTIDNTYLDGVYSKDSSNVTITDNVISNTGRTGAPIERGNGIRMDGGTNNVISDNNITAAKWDGIKVVTSNGVQVTGNDIYDLSRSGVSIDETADAVVSDNEISNVLLGIWSYHNNDIQILNNNVRNIKTSANSNGIQTFEDDGVLISGNIIDNIYLDGVYSKNSSNVTITNNTISNTGRIGAPIERGNGVRLDGGTNNVISNNNITATKWDGIKVVTSNGVQVTGNDIYDLSRSGVSIDATADAVVSDNTINNVLIGVWSYQNSNIQITDNNISNITASANGNGIQSYEDNGVLISGNTVSNAYLNGVYSQGSVNLAIVDNNIDGSGTNGIALNNISGLVTIDSNTITNSAANGVLVRNSFVPTAVPIELRLTGNTISNTAPVNGFAAVNLDITGDGFAELSGNTLGDNFTYGLHAFSGTIDLTGATNTIRNTDIGIGFNPVDPLALALVNDTIGTTAFIDQSQLFVDLGTGALFNPGTPTNIDGTNATYTLGGVTIDPATFGGVTQAEYDLLQVMLNDYNDTADRGLFFFNILPTASAAITIDQKDILRNTFGIPTPQVVGGNLTITGLPLISATATAPATPVAFNPAAIEPAAGDDTTASADDVAAIQPAAGGDTACWSDATTSLGQGAPVTFNYGATGAAMLQNAANCGVGQAAQGQSL